MPMAGNSLLWRACYWAHQDMWIACLYVCLSSAAFFAVPHGIEKSDSLVNSVCLFHQQKIRIVVVPALGFYTIVSSTPTAPTPCLASSLVDSSAAVICVAVFA